MDAITVIVAEVTFVWSLFEFWTTSLYVYVSFGRDHKRHYTLLPGLWPRGS